ncbi:hypothetical protein [Akkermansia muciniphila]|uniref:hypothetical protein n=1 Tax=Akkermansia muciniphila TaxID=239935 RepID=UPI000C9CA997|nr:hypothetical protein [Akkermansia muciniphila]PNC05616.1 hypothetical protein CXU21_00780 [Akkermansia muciniphila]
MQLDFEALEVIPKRDKNKEAPQIYKLAVRAIVLLWEDDGGTWCQDMLGNVWYVYKATLI